MMRSRGFVWLVVLALVGAWVQACSAGVEAEDGDLSVAPIVRGHPDGNRHPGVVALYMDGELCSGTLIAPRAVLTARHCVSRLASENVDCEDPRPQIAGDLPASRIAIVAGESLASGREVARGTTLLVPEGDRLCGADIAIVVLDRAVTGIAPVPVDLSRAPAVRDEVVAVGYGRTSNTGFAGVREFRTSVPIVGVSSREFELGQSTCSGDSGGPALESGTGWVNGVVSRGGASCTSSGTRNVYTRVDAWGALVQEGYRMGGGAPRTSGTSRSPAPAAGAPDDMGAPCATGSDCSSGYCIRSRGTCTMTCDAENPCPTGWYCGLGSGGVHACFRRAS